MGKNKQKTNDHEVDDEDNKDDNEDEDDGDYLKEAHISTKKDERKEV